MRNAGQKIILFLVLTVLVFSPLSPVFSTKTARAVFVTDLGSIAQSTITAVKTSILAVTGPVREFKSKIIKHLKTVAGQLLKKLVIERLVDALVAYISGQRNVIIEDWGEFFEQAGKDAAGKVAEQLAGGLLCSNFDINVRLTLLPQRPIAERVNCSLDDIVGNIDSFMENFENGGWLAYQEQWYPQNNFYGATLLALDEQTRQVAKAVEGAKDQGLAGGGFLSQIKCNPPGTNKNCKIVTPGTWIGDQISTLIGPKKEFFGIINSKDVNRYITAIATAGINRLTKIGVDGLKGRLYGGKKSADYDTTTPQNPCGGLTGEAFKACMGVELAAATEFRSEQASVHSLLEPTLEARQEINSTLTQLINEQTELVDALSELQACKPEDAGILAQLGQEQSVLDDLQNKFEDNQTFLGPLLESSESIDNLQNEDWKNLSNIVLVNEDSADPSDAKNFLTRIKEEQQKINANIASQLPNIEGQLQLCAPAAPSV